MNKIKANILTTELLAPVYEELSDSETINIVGGLISKISECTANVNRRLRGCLKSDEG